MRKVKVVIIIAWTLLVTAMVVEHGREVRGQVKALAVAPSPRRPDIELIDKFDKEIHARFLKMPSFGMGRIAPTTPVKLRSGHIGGFFPQTPVESECVRSFGEQRWDVGIYLFGRRAEPKVVNGKTQDKFSIRYRVNQPVVVAGKHNELRMPEAADLIKEVKQAFLKYQNSKPDEAANYVFDRGDWSYVARPVRAVNESCLKCHNDYVVIDKLPDGQFKLKKREVGDVNGILIYAFRPTK